MTVPFQPDGRPASAAPPLPAPAPPPPPRRLAVWDLVLSIVLTLASIVLGTIGSLFGLLGLAFLDNCPPAGCDSVAHPIYAAFIIATAVVVVAIVATILLLVFRRRAWWVGLLASVVVAVSWWIALH